MENLLRYLGLFTPWRLFDKFDYINNITKILTYNTNKIKTKQFDKLINIGPQANFFFKNQ